MNNKKIESVDLGETQQADFRAYRDREAPPATKAKTVDELLKEVNIKPVVDTGSIRTEMASFESIEPDILDEEIQEPVKKSTKKTSTKKTTKKKSTKNTKKKSVKKTTKKAKKTTTVPDKKNGPKYLTDDTECLHYVLCPSNDKIERYKDGSRAGSFVILGRERFGRACTMNAFELMKGEQDMLRNVGKIPDWIILSRDDVTLLDPAFMDTLRGFKPNTLAVGPIGVTRVRRSAKFYKPESISDVRGAIIQSSPSSNKFKFMQMPEYGEKEAWRVACITAGFIAVRGEIFMDIDFGFMAECSESGFNHIFSDISMEVIKRKGILGVTKTLVRQEDNISNHIVDDSFKRDHLAFLRKWQAYLPVKIENGKCFINEQLYE